MTSKSNFVLSILSAVVAITAFLPNVASAMESLKPLDNFMFGTMQCKVLGVSQDGTQLSIRRNELRSDKWHGPFYTIACDDKRIMRTSSNNLEVIGQMQPASTDSVALPVVKILDEEAVEYSQDI